MNDGERAPDNAFDQLFANPEQPWCPDCRTHREDEGTSRCSSCGRVKVFVPAEMKDGRNICSGIACFCLLGIFFPNEIAALVPAFVCMLIAGSCGSRYSSWAKWAGDKL